MRRHLLFVNLLLLLPLASWGNAQSGHALIEREAPCQVQYARAVETIGLARWSAPEPERPSIERLLNAAAKAKELVDSSFLQWEAPLCSAETLGKLHASVETLQENGWLPSDPEQQREAEAAAANDELLKAINAGVAGGHRVASSSSPGSAAGRRLMTASGGSVAE